MTAYAVNRVEVIPWMRWKSATYNLARTQNSSALGAGYLFCDAASNTGRHVEWDLALKAGTYSLMTTYITVPNAGIITPSVGGVDLSTFDGYTAGTVFNNRSTVTSINVASDGIYEVRFRSDSKNASATDYDLLLQAFAIWVPV